MNLSTWTYSNGKNGVVTGTVDRDSAESLAAAAYLARVLRPLQESALAALTAKLARQPRTA